MVLLGADFSAGLRHLLYQPSNPTGPWRATGIFIVLVLVNQLVLQGIFGAAIAAFGASDYLSFQEGRPRGALLSILPAGLLTACLAWFLARQRGADPKKVLALHVPALGLIGWAAIIAGFLITMNFLINVLVWVFGLDLTSTGMVEQMVMQMSDDPLYLLIAGGLIIGAPLAEELIFRGQIFAALSQTPIGIVGTSVLTSALWAAMHATTQPPPYVIGLLFLMGLVLCWLLVRFGSLWVTIACHAAWNSVQAIALYLLAQQ
ncbi:CPBP family intramembrane glutamic endopeptidase [Taklimakanibacter lacteus]|uniref:CPBP family intramembrane glutamic endopeptidase n=1 Tax=Taklimakanibacter lacteus TaxID=2268456 RepID=UPI000E66ABAE